MVKTFTLVLIGIIVLSISAVAYSSFSNLFASVRSSPLPATTTVYVYGPGGLLSKQAGGEVSYYHKDYLSSSALTTDREGARVYHSDYEPFGDSLHKQGEERYTYTGKEQDANTGLYYYGARYYDASVGRFVSVDPVSGNLYDGQRLNRYSYVMNNPMVYVDVNGEQVEDVGFRVPESWTSQKQDFFFYSEPERTYVDLESELIRQHETFLEGVRRRGNELEMREYGLSIGLEGPGLLDPVDLVAGATAARLLSRPAVAMSSTLLRSVNDEGLSASSAIARQELRNAFKAGTSELQREAYTSLVGKTIPSSIGELTISLHAAKRILQRQISMDELLGSAQSKPFIQVSGEHAGDLLFRWNKVKIAVNPPSYTRPFYIKTAAVDD